MSIDPPDAKLVETDMGILPFPPRPNMHPSILEFLRDRPRSSRELEDALAEQYGITSQMRNAMLPGGIRLGETTFHGHWSISSGTRAEGVERGRSSALEASARPMAGQWEYIA